MFQKKQSLPDKTSQQAIRVLESAASLLNSISHKPSELQKLDSIATGYSALSASADKSVAAGVGMAAFLAAAAAPFTLGTSLAVGAAVAGAATAKTLTQKNTKAEGIILLLEEQCQNAENYRGMDYNKIDRNGQSLLSTIINNASLLISLTSQ
ncbi:MAG: hypothetical protein HFI69_11930 [Lachnospiraceae bacterium]|nr:hypothetical protein [Lachnospiraceae bacterium]